ncbi:transcriptional repressor [Saccharopolyspora taberi]
MRARTGEDPTSAGAGARDRGSVDPLAHRTRQRRAVFRALSGRRGFVSAHDLYDAMRSAGDHIGLATVYRSLHALVASGHAETFHDDTGVQLFCVLAPAGRGYRLACRVCHRRVPIEVAPVESWAADLAADHEFTDVHLVFELTGLCSACSSPQPEAAASGDG